MNDISRYRVFRAVLQKTSLSAGKSIVVVLAVTTYVEQLSHPPVDLN